MEIPLRFWKLHIWNQKTSGIKMIYNMSLPFQFQFFGLYNMGCKLFTLNLTYNATPCHIVYDCGKKVGHLRSNNYHIVWPLKILKQKGYPFLLSPKYRDSPTVSTFVQKQPYQNHYCKCYIFHPNLTCFYSKFDVYSVNIYIISIICNTLLRFCPLLCVVVRRC